MLYSENKKRGFTLVELIVVLVILAILAALLIPALTGYIDKAKKDQVIAETRMLHEAVQTEMVELYGSNVNWKNNGLSTIANDKGNTIALTTTVGTKQDLQNRYAEIAKLSEVPSLQPNSELLKQGKSGFLVLVTGSAKIHAIVYNSGRGYIGLYCRDTNQYTAYKLGDKTDYGTVTDTNLSGYYSSLYYTSAVDAVPDGNGNYSDDNYYWWSCNGIRGLLGVGKLTY